MRALPPRSPLQFQVRTLSLSLPPPSLPSPCNPPPPARGRLKGRIHRIGLKAGRKNSCIKLSCSFPFSCSLLLPMPKTTFGKKTSVAAPSAWGALPLYWLKKQAALKARGFSPARGRVAGAFIPQPPRACQLSPQGGRSHRPLPRPSASASVPYLLPFRYTATDSSGRGSV